jgi:hypothetical protein
MGMISVHLIDEKVMLITGNKIENKDEYIILKMDEKIVSIFDKNYVKYVMINC